MKLGKLIEKEQPISRVVAECEKCNIEIYDSLKESLKRPYTTANTIKVKYLRHRNKTGHNQLQIDIDKQYKREEEIEITVNVEK